MQIQRGDGERERLSVNTIVQLVNVIGRYLRGVMRVTNTATPLIQQCAIPALLVGRPGLVVVCTCLCLADVMLCSRTSVH